MSSLFQPLQINRLTLKNRLVMPPMALNIATEQGAVSAELFEHYTERCGKLAPIGLIIVEHTYISPDGRAHPRQLGLSDDSLIPGLKMLVDQVHKLGVKIGLQLTHAGGRALHSPTGPSAVNCPHLLRFGQNEQTVDDIPRELSLQEIKSLIVKFAEAASRAKKAGFDLIEIHGAHGYLLNQFYSPLTNRRTDSYGGSLERRLRFPLEVLEAVKKVLGSDFPLFFRFGADDRLPGGNTLADAKQAVPYLEEVGVDCLDLSGGIGGYIKNGPEGFFVYLAEGLKPVTRLPLLVTGGITKPATAEKIIRKKQADLVGVGRALLKDPDWVSNAWLELTSGTKDRPLQNGDEEKDAT
jgi:NADPH2 dehydrogenase